MTLNDFIMSGLDIMDIRNKECEIPFELHLEDVFSFYMLFKNKSIATEWILKHSVKEDTKERIESAFSENKIGNFDWEGTTIDVYIERYSLLTELNSGVCILWEAY